MIYDLYDLCICHSRANSFEPIGMKLCMDTPWDPGSDIGYVSLHFATRNLHQPLRHKVFTPPQNRRGVVFLLQFVCVCVCV